VRPALRLRASFCVCVFSLRLSILSYRPLLLVLMLLAPGSARQRRSHLFRSWSLLCIRRGVLYLVRLKVNRVNKSAAARVPLVLGTSTMRAPFTLVTVGQTRTNTELLTLLTLRTPRGGKFVRFLLVLPVYARVDVVCA